MRACALLLGLLLAGAARAHEVRPAYLELKEIAVDTYDLFWKVPARGADERLALHLRLPESCRNAAPPSTTMHDVAYVERSRVVCPGGLTGGEVHVEGLAATLTDVLARVERADGSTQVTRLTPDRPSFVVEAAPSALEVVRKIGRAHV